MFPLSYKNRISVDYEIKKDRDKIEFLEIFMGYFDNPKKISQDTISFDNFNIFYKRHKWLNDGKLKITVDGNKVHADLTLYFYSAPIIFFIITVAFLTLNYQRLFIVLFQTLTLWIFFALMYLWTSTMFRKTIKNIIKKQIYLHGTKALKDNNIVIVKDKCPACGNWLNISDTICSECGIVFG